MQYRLIKIDNYYIIVSDEGCITGRLHYNFREKEIEYSRQDSKGNLKNLIIASQNPEHNLPTITFSDEVAKELGIVDVEQEAVNYASNRRNGGGFGYPSFTASCIEKGYNKGYNQALSDNKDKLFTLKQLINNFKPAFDKFINEGGAIGSSDEYIQWQNVVNWFPKYLQSLTKQEWDIIGELKENNFIVTELK